MLSNEREVDLEVLLKEVGEMKGQGYRLVTTTCLQAEDGLQVIYHFDRDYCLSHLRVKVPSGRTVPSVSAIYPGAFMAENEMKDFFGLKVSGLPIDYQGRLFLAEDAPITPMLKVTGREGAAE